MDFPCLLIRLIDMTLTLFRSMRTGADKLPECGDTARHLGARQGHDIPVCTNGTVLPATGGMSVAIGTPSELPPHRRPASLDGSGSDPVFAIHLEVLPSNLATRQSGRKPRHYLVEPSEKCLYLVFQATLCGTRHLWEEVAQ
jgi:hypothetical protein